MNLYALLGAVGATVLSLAGALWYGHRSGKAKQAQAQAKAFEEMTSHLDTVLAASDALEAEIRTQAKMNLIRKVDDLEKQIGRRLTVAELESAAKSAEDALHRAMVGK